MKKIVIMLLFFPIMAFSKTYTQEGETKFIIAAGHQYEFDVKLKAGMKYRFGLIGTTFFNMQIMEKTGNKWGLNISNIWGNMEVFEEIYETSTYKIIIYSAEKQDIIMTWGQYND